MCYSPNFFNKNETTFYCPYPVKEYLELMLGYLSYPSTRSIRLTSYISAFVWKACDKKLMTKHHPFRICLKHARSVWIRLEDIDRVGICVELVAKMFATLGFVQKKLEMLICV